MVEKTINRILRNYDFGSLISYQVYSTGTVQENIRLDTDRGKYVLKYYKSRTIDYVLFELSLVEYLIRKDFCCASLFKTKSDELYTLHDKKVVAIYKWIEGEHKKVLKYNHLDQLIQKIAELHLITENLQLAGYKHRWNYGVEFCLNYISDKLKKKTATSSLQKKKWLKAELNNLILPNGMSQGIVHGDLDLSNIIFENEELKAIIDFDDSNYTYLLFDIIGLIDRKNYKFLSNKYFELIRYIFKKYEEVRSFKAEDKAHLFDVLKLSIIIDCFWFFDRGNYPEFVEKDKIEQLNKLGREKFSSKLE